MDDTLQRLLDAEVRAEKIAQEAEAEQESIIQGAITEAQAQEDRFRAGIPDLHDADLRRTQASTGWGSG